MPCLMLCKSHKSVCLLSKMYSNYSWISHDARRPMSFPISVHVGYIYNHFDND